MAPQFKSIFITFVGESRGGEWLTPFFSIHRMAKSKLTIVLFFFRPVRPVGLFPPFRGGQDRKDYLYRYHKPLPPGGAAR